MTTRNLLDAIKSLAATTALAAGLAALCSAPASAQQISPTDKMLLFNVAGAVGRKLDFSMPNTAVYMYPTNASQPRQQWSFTRDQYGLKIASISDPNEVLSPLDHNYWNGAPVDEVKDLGSDASRWELVRVQNLPFYQIRNVHNPSLCLANFLQTYMPVRLAACDWNENQQWYSLMTSTGILK